MAETATAEQAKGDVLVIFGITGDLAKVMTFRSLYRLEARGLLDCPIVGVAVDDWTRRPAARARARGDRGRPARQLDEEVFARFAARLSYVRGDFADAGTYARVGGRDRAARSTPVFYLEIPPLLFGTGRQGAARGRPDEERRASSSRSRSATTSRRRARSRRSCTSTSTSRSSTGSTTSSARWGWRRSSTCASRTRCSSRSGTATTSRACRSRWPRASASRTAATSTTRSARCATSSSTTCCRWSPPAAMEAPSGSDADDAQERAGRRSSARSSTPTPRTTCAASTTATRRSTASPPDSTTETYAALRLEIENWRWSGVPFFIRTGKRLPVTQTELRLVFKRPAAARLRDQRRAPPEPNQLVVRLDPSTGIRLRPRRAPRRSSRARRRSRSTWSSPRRAARARRRTRCCCTRRWSATPPASRARTASRRPGGSCSRCSTRRRPSTPTRPAPGARARPTSSSPATAAGTSRGSRLSSPPRTGSGDAPSRSANRDAAPQSAARTVAVPADRRLRVPLRLPHRRAVAPDGSIDWLCVPALRRPERVRQPARPRGRLVPASARSASTHPTARAYVPGTNVLRDDLEDADGLGRRPRRADDRAARRRGHGHAAHPAAGRRRRRAHARAHRRVHRGRRRGRARLRARVRLRARRRPSGRWSTATGTRGRRDRRRADGPAQHRPAARHRGQSRARPPHAGAGRAGLLRAVVGRGARRPAGRRRGDRAARRDDALLARVARAARGSPTTAGATRSSARRWRSRA